MLVSRTWIALLFAALLCPQILGDSPNIDKSETKIENSNASSATLELARETMEYWESEIARQPVWHQSNSPSEKNYFDNWSTIDLNKSIEMEEAEGKPWLRFLLMRKLAAQGRWDDLVKVGGRFKKGAYDIQKFWARIAEQGVAINDIEVVQLAGEQIEANAMFEQGLVGAPKHPTLQLAVGRFFVAASRLELLHNMPLDDQKQHKVNLAINELWQASDSFSPVNGGLGMLLNHHTVGRDYTALESWNEANPGHIDGLAREAAKDVEPLVGILDKSVYWHHSLELPNMGKTIVTPWILRQLNQKRFEVVLTYLSFAKGNALDRARLLAIVAQHLESSDQDKAKTVRELADFLLTQTAKQLDETSNWLRVEAMAEVATAFDVADLSRGKQLAIDSAKSFCLLASEKEYNYDSLTAVLFAASNCGLKRADLPQEFLVYANKLGFHNRILSNYPLYTRGVTRNTDVSDIVIVRKENDRYEEHQKYHELVKQKDWPAVIEEIKKLAEGNDAWVSSYPETGAESVNDLGLKATLEWTRKISSPQIRFSTEMGAVEEAVRPMRKSLPAYRDTNSPEAIVPTLRWPKVDC